MKTNVFQMTAKMLALTAMLAFAMTSCEKDEDEPTIAKEDLVGKWEFTSFKVDTSEYIGVVVDSAGIKFDAFTGAQGNFSQTVVYEDGDRDELSGKYQVKESTNEVIMIALGDTNTAKITLLNDSKLEWKGKQENKNLTVKAKRK
ncbi:MAG: hypothetical protein IT270_01475 [Saprospiraceae bacterium]|nr:hypothetical protein [Saprospiraceae bacterium]